MDYRETTDRIAALNITQQTLAEAQGTTLNMVARARLDPSSADYRKPSAGWQAAVAKLARNRSKKLANLAAMLDPRGEHLPVERAVGTMLLGSEYVSAASRQNLEDVRCDVTYFLLGHGLELTFKSILIANGTSERTLKTIGHDLEAALAAAREVAPDVVQVDEIGVAYVGLVAPYYGEKAFEYVEPGFQTRPPPDGLWDFVSTLASRISAYVDATVRSALRARREGEGPGTPGADAERGSSAAAKVAAGFRKRAAELVRLADQLDRENRENRES